MSPFREIEQAVRQAQKLYGTLEIDKALPELRNVRTHLLSIRDGAVKLYAVLSYALARIHDISQDLSQVFINLGEDQRSAVRLCAPHPSGKTAM